MLRRPISRKSFATCTLLASLCLLLAVPSAQAQGLGGSPSSTGGGGLSSLGGSSAGGGGGGGGAGGASALTGQSLSTGGGIGSTAGIGSGNLSALGNGYGLSSLSNSTSKGSTNGYPTISNPYQPFYANPYMAGVAGTNTSDVFGTAVFPITATTSTMTAQTNTNKGFTTLGLRRAPSYVTTVSDDLPLIQHTPVQLEQNLRQVLQSASSLSPRDSIRLVVEGGIVRLQGQVVSERDRRLAESLILLTQGVQQVVNELTVTP